MATEEILANAHLEGTSLELAGGKTGILLLHGFTATTVEVRPFGEYLFQNGYSVSAPLLPGHGTQPDDLNQKKWQDWTVSVEDAYQSLKKHCDMVFVGGESMGGLLSLYLASRHPEICGLLLFAPALIAPNLKRAKLLTPFMRSLPKRSDKNTRPLPKPWQGYHVNPLAAAYQVSLLQKEVKQRLKFITQPAIIFQGGADRTIDPRSSQAVFDGIQSEVKSYHWYQDASHCIILESCSDEIYQIGLQFIQRISQTKN
jgi:carboxylesterase